MMCYPYARISGILSEEIEAILRDANMKMIDAVGAGCRYTLP
jgi:hypothetical protein